MYYIRDRTYHKRVWCWAQNQEDGEWAEIGAPVPIKNILDAYYNPEPIRYRPVLYTASQGKKLTLVFSEYVHHCRAKLGDI